MRASASAAVPAGLESFYNQKVSWYACDKKGMGEATSGKDTGFTCAKVKVPLDYDNPGGETIEIAVKKRAASEDSVGSLFVNPGGPGGSGIELVESADPLLPRQWGPTETATISYGHGLAVSPLSVAAAFAAITNGGVYVQPTLQPVRPGETVAGEQVLDPDVSQHVLDLMREMGADARSAVIYGKPRSVVDPDFVWRRTDEWIVFPWSAEPPVTPSVG